MEAEDIGVSRKKINSTDLEMKEIGIVVDTTIRVKGILFLI